MECNGNFLDIPCKIHFKEIDENKLDKKSKIY